MKKIRLIRRNRYPFLPLLLCFAICMSCKPKVGIDDHWVKGVEKPEIFLNGTWKFSMEPPAQFWMNDVDFCSWSTINVPGECQMQGFAIKHDQSYVYKHAFHVPEDFEGKRIFIDFHGVYSYARVWINGEFVREHYGGFTKWSCDITNWTTAGETAILTVEIVDRTDDISYGSGYAKHQIGGILRDVVLKALPEQNFEQLFLEAELDETYRDADLQVKYHLSLNSLTTIKVDLFDEAKNLVTSQIEITKEQSGTIEIPVVNPMKWDAEHPNLYTAVVSIFQEGEELMRLSERFGFREVEIDGNKLLVNGKSVKLRGACRHDIHPLLGRMTTKEYDLKDVLLAKEANMNFIRTSHYPPSEAFLEYCDEYGIYVEDETAVCFVGSHRTFDYQATGATQNDPIFTDRYLSQLREMVDNHRNHPSIIMWSIGNENVFGSNFTKSYEWIKQNDKTRPVIYSYPGPVPDSLKNYEILSMHYPSWEGNLNQYGIITEGFAFDEMPVLFDEWAHVACYNNPTLRYDPNVRSFWGESLDKMWEKLFEADGGLGGAIWCMNDETFMLPEDMEGFNEWWGKLDPHVIPATYMGPTVGYGEWGIIDTWRRRKPEFWATKKAYTPTRIMVKEVMDFTPGEALVLPVHNRFDHTDFNELIITYEYQGQTGQLKDVELPPHEKGQLTISAHSWENDSKLQISFADNAGNIYDEYEIQIGSREVNLPELRQKGELQVSENDDVIAVSGVDYSVDVNKMNGLLSNVVVGEDTLIKSGPFIHLSIPGKRVQYSTIQMSDYAKNWYLQEFNHAITNGILSIDIEGNYDSIQVTFNIKLDSEGLFLINYEISSAPADKKVQEAGIKFIVGEQFDSLEWVRKSFFTAYPEFDLGRPTGKVSIHAKPEMGYREKPMHEWQMDSKGFYYHGLEEELSYTNIVRSLKENVYSYELSGDNGSIEVIDDANQACRFDKMDGSNQLIINDHWDYQSLLWGNYMKMILTTEVTKGQVKLKIK